MSTETLIGRDMYVKTTHPNGNAHIDVHRVWDGPKFLASMNKQALERAKKDGVKPDVITLATEAEYRNAR